MQIRSSIVWRAVLDKLPTYGVLQRFGYQGPSICALCCAAPDSQDHILFDCRFIRSIYDSFFALFDVHLCYDWGFYNLLLQAQHVTFVTTVWAFWHARNCVVHDDVHPSHHGLMISILSFIREAQSFHLGSMHGVSDLFICRCLRVPAVPRPPRMAVHPVETSSSLLLQAKC